MMTFMVWSGILGGLATGFCAFFWGWPVWILFLVTWTILCVLWWQFGAKFLRRLIKRGIFTHRRGLLARADEQNAACMGGDLVKGVFGDYPPDRIFLQIYRDVISPAKLVTGCCMSQPALRHCDCPSSQFCIHRECGCPIDQPCSQQCLQTRNKANQIAKQVVGDCFPWGLFMGRMVVADELTGTVDSAADGELAH